jgi:hypothetical protein
LMSSITLWFSELPSESTLWMNNATTFEEYLINWNNKETKINR